MRKIVPMLRLELMMLLSSLMSSTWGAWSSVRAVPAGALLCSGASRTTMIIRSGRCCWFGMTATRARQRAAVLPEAEGPERRSSVFVGRGARESMAGFALLRDQAVEGHEFLERPANELCPVIFEYSADVVIAGENGPSRVNDESRHVQDIERSEQLRAVLVERDLHTRIV